MKDRNGFEVVGDGELCDGLPEYNGWHASYEYPGYIFYHHPTSDLCVCLSSDFNENEMLDVQVQNPVTGWSDDGTEGTSGGGNLPWPYEGRTSEKMFALVKPFLDEYQNFEMPGTHRDVYPKQCEHCNGKGWVSR